MELGIAYYPEHENHEQWKIDFGKLADAGIDMIRIAEFAWTVLEPEDGRYCWEWLDRAIEEAGAHGLRVVLCTPTACPPVWLAEKCPDILPVNKEGRTIGFGARQHRSYHSEAYLQHALRIVRLMAQRYGQHPNVVAWQLDNEFGGETKYDFGKPARQAFHAYLERKYGTIEQLNRRWGTVFWSQTYARFDQIPLPAPIGADVMMWHHPSLELDYARFSSDGMARFARLQAETLRPFIGDRPITTNAFMFRWGDNLDWSDLFASLDVVGMDIYSDRPHEIAFYSDACRGVLSRPFWMMEYGTASARLADEMELARGRGCSRFFLFKAKPFPWGQEQGKGSPELLTLTGEPSANYAVIKNYANTASQKPPVTAAEAGKEKIGLYYHFASSWAYRISVADRLAYSDYLVDTVYRTLFEREADVRIVYSAEQLQGLETLIVPLHIIHDPRLEEALIRFVQDGGKLVATSDLFRKNEDNVFLTRIPSIYPLVFGWQEPNFVQDTPASSDTVTSVCGAGRSWLVPREMTDGQWRQLLEQVLGSGEGTGNP